MTFTSSASRSAWTGWVVFAGITMLVLGSLQALMGLVGIFNTDFYVVTASGLAVPVNYTIWGWFHLIMGVIVLLAGAVLPRDEAVLVERDDRLVGLAVLAIPAYEQGFPRCPVS